MSEIELGDKITFQGLFVMAPNPTRAWWQWWKPKRVLVDELLTLTVVAIERNQHGGGDD